VFSILNLGFDIYSYNTSKLSGKQFVTNVVLNGLSGGATLFFLTAANPLLGGILVGSTLVL
jgi:hypothetical protein